MYIASNEPSMAAPPQNMSQAAAFAAADSIAASVFALPPIW
jgi:hypothetical protein